MESGPPAERATFELYSQPDFKFIQQIFRAHTILHENEAFIFLRLSFLFVGSEEMKQRGWLFLLSVEYSDSSRSESSINVQENE